MNGRIRTNLILKIWKALSTEFVEGKIRLKNYFLEFIRKLFDIQNNTLLLCFFNSMLGMQAVSSNRVKPPVR